MFASIRKNFVSLMIVLSYGHEIIARAMTNFGHWYQDLLMFHGDTGEITWAVVEEESADGYITVRVVTDGVHEIQRINFRVGNRWPVRDGRNPGQAFLFRIRSKALAAGYPIISTYWYTDTIAVIERLPLDVAAPIGEEGPMTRWLRGLAGRMNQVDNSIDNAMREDLMRGVVRRV